MVERAGELQSDVFPASLAYSWNCHPERSEGSRWHAGICAKLRDSSLRSAVTAFGDYAVLLVERACSLKNASRSCILNTSRSGTRCLTDTEGCLHAAVISCPTADRPAVSRRASGREIDGRFHGGHHALGRHWHTQQLFSWPEQAGRQVRAAAASRIHDCHANARRTRCASKDSQLLTDDDPPGAVAMLPPGGLRGARMGRKSCAVFPL